jgi:ubiquinone/menaquinone biosynthesis C-methylase UbiE
MPLKMGFQKTIDWYDQNTHNYAGATFCHEGNAKIFASFLTGKRILDAGCGPGHDTAMFTRMGYDATGIDISGGLLAEARISYPQSEFIKGNLLSLPFADGTFDGVWAQASILHFETENEINQALSEFNRVFVTSGILYVLVKKQISNTKTAVVSDKLSDHDRFFHYFTQQGISNLLINSGFKILRCENQTDIHGRKDVTWIMVISKKIQNK